MYFAFQLCVVGKISSCETQKFTWPKNLLFDFLKRLVFFERQELGIKRLTIHSFIPQMTAGSKGRTRPKPKGSDTIQISHVTGARALQVIAAFPVQQHRAGLEVGQGSWGMSQCATLGCWSYHEWLNVLHNNTRSCCLFL